MDRTQRAQVELLISTMNRTEPPDVLRLFGPSDPRPALLTINQCDRMPPPAELSRPGSRMLSFAETGLSRSRNRALDASLGDVLLLGDDDLTYLPSVQSTLQRAFAAHPDATAITFQFLDAATHQPLKRYRSRGFRHGALSIASVSSVEIALRRERLDALRFDTRFGLAARYPTGEEAIFLADLLRAEHALYYWPEPVCLHPGPSSGQRHWDATAAEAKGAVFRRIYGSAWPAVAAGFAVLKHSAYRRSIGLPRWLWHSLRGGLRLH